MHTENIDLVAKALHQLQNELENINRETKAYNYKYATLASCLDHIRPLLFKYDLSVCQVGDFDDHGNYYVVTYLLHNSGQYLKSRFIYKKESETQGIKTGGDVEMKDLGLRISYIRRYALCAIVGLTQADDEDKLDILVNKPQKLQKPLPPIYHSEKTSEVNKKKLLQTLCETNGIDIKDFAKHYSLSTVSDSDLQDYIKNFDTYSRQYLESIFSDGGA
jgi:hypothetical protein